MSKGSTVAKPKVYLETTVISYLVARPSKDSIINGHQRITKAWWKRDRKNFEMYVSQAVLREISKGNPHFASLRLKMVKALPSLASTAEVERMADIFVHQGPIPPKVAEDALHISFAAVHGMHYLLTWNCRHIANAYIRERLEKICLSQGMRLPIICTPDELRRI